MPLIIGNPHRSYYYSDSHFLFLVAENDVDLVIIILCL
jgi:hypothetical protein